MACDLTENQKRIGWQKEEPGNAPCACQLGFQFDGSLSNEYWVEWDQNQTDSKWAFLDGGNKVTQKDFISGPGCRYLFGSLLGGESIAVVLFGSNYPIALPPAVPESGFYTVRFFLRVASLHPSDPLQSRIEDGETYELWPGNNIKPNVTISKQTWPISGGPPTVIGEATLTPLKCDNVC